MGEPANKLRAEIDLGEFERRLRAPSSSPANHEDPLAELARLVDGKTVSGGNDPFRELFAPRPAPASRAPAAVPALGREHAFPGDLRGTIDITMRYTLTPRSGSTHVKRVVTLGIPWSLKIIQPMIVRAFRVESGRTLLALKAYADKLT